MTKCPRPHPFYFSSSGVQK